MAEENSTATDIRERVRTLTAAIDAAKQKNKNSNTAQGRAYHRTPYPIPAYRSTRGRVHSPYYGSNNPQYRNRTLHVHSRSQPALSSVEVSDGEAIESTSESWVSKRDRHLQLINKSVYDKMVEEQLTNDLSQHRGSANTLYKPTPSERGTNPAQTLTSRNSISTTSKPPLKTELCRNFCLTGQCRKGSRCSFIHDPAKVAICKEYLAKGTCHKDPYCDLSHSPNPHRVSPCIHFLRGNCTNANCRYPHYQTNPQAPICVKLVTLGYCEKGINCAARHEIECPEYASKGSCSNPKCRLPHIDHAGQMSRNNTKQPSKSSSPQEEVSLLDSLEAAFSDEQLRDEQSPLTDSDTGTRANQGKNPAFSQGDNFMSLEVDPDGVFEQRFGS